MTASKNIRKNIASMLAVVFVWLVIGSLVNFHQHHVYGKILIFHASSSLSLKKDEQAAGTHRCTLHAGPTSLVMPEHTSMDAAMLCGIRIVRHINGNPSVTGGIDPSGELLRAPPQA